LYILAPIGVAAMPTRCLLVVLGVLSLLVRISMAQSGGEGFFPQYPSLTPDGRYMIFSSAGDLWAVRADAGEAGAPATRLTSHPADELRSAVSPDGRLLAFESNRDGARNIYIADLSMVSNQLVAGEPRRVTAGDVTHNLTGFSHDGERILFSSFQERDIYREERMYAAPLDGGPVMRLTDAYGEHPSMRDDGRTLVFARGSNNGVRPKYRGPATGDLWRLDLASGAFTRLTDDRYDNIEPRALPDGSVVFISSRDGQYNLWRIGSGGGEPVALTRFAPGAGEVSIGHGVRDLSVSRDGSTAGFVVWDTLHTLDLTRDGAGAREVRVRVSGDSDAPVFRRMNLDREGTEAVLSPDGQTIAIVARGELFVRSTKENHPTRRVTQTEARVRDIDWSPDGVRLYFVSDHEGPPSIYAATVALSRHDLEAEPAPPTVEPEATPSEAPVEAAEPGSEPVAEPDPDAPSEPGAEPEADEESPAKEEKKDKGPSAGDRWAQALRFEITPVVVSSEHSDTRPVPSPDGRQLLFVRGRGDLMHADLVSGAIVTLEGGWSQPEAVWAWDSRHIVFSRQDLKFNTDLFLLDTEAARTSPGSPGAEAVNITRHPDLDISPRLSRDGKVLYFLSDRDGPNWAFDVYAVFLDKSLESLPEYELAERFKEAAKEMGKHKPIDPVKFGGEADGAGEAKTENGETAGEPMKFDVADAFLRVRRLTSIPAAEGNLAITPAGDRVLFTSAIDDERGLYSVDHRGRERKTIATGAIGAVSVSLTGDKAVFIRGGQAHHAPPAGGKTETLAIDAPVSIDTAAERRFNFREAARVFGDSFYHPTLKGLDWARLTERYEALALQTRTAQAFTRVLAMMFGEVDGSHTGSWGGDGFSAPSPRIGHLAIDAQPVADGYEVARVLRDGPADKGEKGLLAGDLITAIDGVPLADPGNGVRDLSGAMLGAAGKETLVTVERPGDAGPRSVNLLLIPHSSGAEADIRYRDEVERREARVHEWSDGRIGYLHIRGMSEPSVREYERDLFAAAEGREALIIDVRDNGGGWTTDILLASLTAPAHAYTVPRGADPAKAEFDSYPRDRRLIHAYQRPLSVLMNQNSYSNAEIFSHAIKTIGRGRLVGVETHGAVISTGAHTLIDGTVIRIPFRGWYLPDGRDMDVYGAAPDLEVHITPADEASGADPQLRAAVEDLLDRLRRGES
jgi:tricorn protease